VQSAAVRFQDQSSYNASVLSGVHVAHPAAIAAPEPTGITLSDVASGVGSAVGSVGVALLALYWRRIPGLRERLQPGVALVGVLREIQSGLVNDYVTWMVIGMAGIGGALAFAIH
jgi:multicomponent Na+:H+ antiporter subunit D